VDKVGDYYVFDIAGNRYRLIAAIHFNTQMLMCSPMPIRQVEAMMLAVKENVRQIQALAEPGGSGLGYGVVSLSGTTKTSSLAAPWP